MLKCISQAVISHWTCQTNTAYQKGLSQSKMYFRINGPFRLNILFCFGIGLRHFSNKASSSSDRRGTNIIPFPSLCCSLEDFPPLFLPRKRALVTQVWQASSCGTAGWGGAGVHCSVCRPLRSCIPGGEILPHSEPKQLQHSLQWFKVLPVSVVELWNVCCFHWASGSFARGELQTLGLLLWWRMNLPILSAVSVRQPLPFTGGCRCSRHTKGRPASTWQAMSFFKLFKMQMKSSVNLL